MSPIFRLAHLSDPHLGPMPVFWPWHWNLKRIFGFANWMGKRRHVHLPFLANLILDDVHAQRVDQIAISGDLTNIGMPAEYRRALAWLKRAGTPKVVSTVPGNHDIYCRLWLDRGTSRWAEYMSSMAPEQDGTGVAGESFHNFPFVRRWGNIALVGVNSAIPTALGSAVGYVDNSQRRRLENILTKLNEQKVCRVVMIHHPPLPKQAPAMRALRDANLLEEVLMTAGAELVIHGHNHKAMLEYREWQGRPFPIVGVPSCSNAVTSSSPAAYNIYTFTPNDAGYEITLVQRQVTKDATSVSELKREILMPRI